MSMGNYLSDMAVLRQGWAAPTFPHHYQEGIIWWTQGMPKNMPKNGGIWAHIA